MILPDGVKTFVAPVRVDLRDIATVAKFLADNSWEIPGKSGGKLASTAIRIFADHLKKIKLEYNVEGTEEAINTLRYLGYGESLVPGRKDFKPLLKQLSKESMFLDTVESGQSSLLNQEASRLTKKFFSEDNSPSVASRALAETVLSPTENKPKPEPEPESPQLKTRTADDEKKDISKLRTAMSNFSGAPIAK